MLRIDSQHGVRTASRGRFLVAGAISEELRWLRPAPMADFVRLETGEGVHNAERSLRERLHHERFEAVISIGFAGSLSTELLPGDLVVAEAVHGASAPSSELIAVARRISVEGLQPKLGIAITVDWILDVSSKREVAASFSPEAHAFADMESMAVARICTKVNTPFLIIRSISDGLDEDFPIDFNRCRNADGRISKVKVLRSLALKPLRISGMLELRKRTDLCARRLAMAVDQLLNAVQENQVD